MKRKLIRNKKMRYGSVSVALTVLVILVAILVNMLATAVTERYSLYTSMVGKFAFDVTEDCYDVLDRAFKNAKNATGADPHVTLLFCDTEANVKAVDSTNFYLYQTAMQLDEHFDAFEVKFHDVFANPKPIKDYLTQTNPLTGEEIDVSIYADSVIVISEDYHRVYNASDFYVYDTESSEAWAYAGEKKLAAAIMSAMSKTERVACLLNNHGEIFYDYELLTLLDEAGYTVGYIDLYKDEIPENCDLLISFNPSTDLVTTAEMSEKSEVDILENFLSEDGNSFLVFFSNNTPTLPNFERYLKEWGVQSDYAKNSNGVSYRYTVQDPGKSLTSDNTTVYGVADERVASRYGNLIGEDHEFVIFRSATSFSVSNEGYLDNKDGTYRNASGTRTMYPLYRTSDTAEAWVGGRMVAGGGSILASVTEQTTADGGRSYVGAFSSVQFATTRYLRSAVYHNTDVLLRLISEFAATEQNGERVPHLTTEGLSVKPFLVQDISTVTTAQILRWTLTLALIPAVIFSATGVVILVRRRRA
ncbi:MAG: Gldg family protein [Clostridia bacterium]|nr:Gldg family protein [Clostridia bacterium]